jgi:hypothetical protein
MVIVFNATFNVSGIEFQKKKKEKPNQNSFIVSFFVVPCYDEVQGH